MEDDPGLADFKNVLETMRVSISSSRGVLKSVLDESPSDIDFRDGISLLSSKQHVLISYLRSLALISARRALGHTLNERSQTLQVFSALSREPRGNDLGDQIDSTIEGRIILEKIGALESRMRYQIGKLLKSAEDSSTAEAVNDPLSFRPNPANLADDGTGHSDEEKTVSEQVSKSDVYRPPQLAPMPYVEKPSKKERRRGPIPTALSQLAADPSRPHVESTTGLGGIPSLASGRAKYLKQLTEYEEDNFTRVVTKKSEAKRRARDEEDLALGGDLADSGSGRRRRRAGGLEDEFGDVLRSVERGISRHGTGDGYEELRERGKRKDVLSRSRMTRSRDTDDVEVDGERQRKRSRFDLEAKNIKKKFNKRSK
ncbi:hypothetical protein FA15DRAFT_663101 [Coprinopsis marcescibilis]|uniref:Neuroguidin n=1 Tax=Coprinopsis marcescibilis TaxID=230819 RepID=A0A5C3LAN3_COPMA|nr:hypothetical protein FA15DRAFT_663101 [Coprinopsis marcescibilis]